jgi:hypothetical protein
VVESKWLMTVLARNDTGKNYLRIIIKLRSMAMESYSHKFEFGYNCTGKSGFAEIKNKLREIRNEWAETETQDLPSLDFVLVPEFTKKDLQAYVRRYRPCKCWH